MEWAIRSAALVLCQSRTQMEACERKWGVRPDRLVIVRNGHALVDGVEERSRGCVAWIGSLKPVKRPELYLELASVSRALPVRFVMAGTPFGAPWETWVENGARHDSEVEYRGALGHDEVVELLKDSVALVCTSVREGFPNTFIEAWMCETPVVSVGIDPDATLSELGLGILVDDLAAARNAIARLVEDETLARDIGRRARAYVEEQHDINKVAERLNGLLEGLLGPRE
jgi:glycosyltransferase involved in cell wall biosynthesis